MKLLSRSHTKRKGFVIGAAVLIVGFIIAVTIGLYVIAEYELALNIGASGIPDATQTKINDTFATGYNALKLAGIGAIVLGAAVIIAIITRMGR